MLVFFGCCFNVNSVFVLPFLSIQTAGLPLNCFFPSAPHSLVISLPLLPWMVMEEFIFRTDMVASCLGALRRTGNQFSLKLRTSWRFRIYGKPGITLACELDYNKNASYLSKMLIFNAFLGIVPYLCNNARAVYSLPPGRLQSLFSRFKELKYC